MQLRPVVVMAGGEAIQLYQYKQSSGTDTNSGWSKQWLTKYLDPFVWGDTSNVIGNQKWELGVNIFSSAFYSNGTSYAGTGGYYNGAYTETASTSLTYTIKSLDKNEAELGTIWTGTFSTNDFQSVAISGLKIIDMTFNGAQTCLGSGSWTGPANAFLCDMSWIGSVAATLSPPIVGGLTATAGGHAYPSYVNV